MKIVSQLGLLVFLVSGGTTPACEAFSNPQLKTTQPNNNINEVAVVAQEAQPQSSSRRELFQKTASSIVGITGAIALPGLVLAPSQPAFASGGATAGKYTTIPIAKRRYYGRVQAAVHEFLLLGPEVVKADFSAPTIQAFFDINGLVVVQAKRKDINGSCTKKDKNCKGKEVRDSQYNDMKTSMYLLGNAFRLNQTKAPDNLPSVRAAKKFFKEMDLVEKATKKGRKNDKDSVIHYAAALEALDCFLDLVELPPTDSGNYDKEFSRATGDSARIT